MEKSFYSNGKLLLTAEYLVLDGAKALAIPTKFGQSLYVNTGREEGLHWKSLDENGAVWFEDTIYHSKGKFISNNASGAISNTLITILTEAKKLNPDFLENNPNLEITTTLDFNRSWGLGSSSTLINNIAKWSQTDAFKLLEKSFGGSGYDIACAGSDTPLLYSNSGAKPSIEEVELKWDFKDELFFVYLNKKQDSKEGIKRYKQLSGNLEPMLTRVNTLTEAFVTASNISELEYLMQQHEDLISGLLNLPKVKGMFLDYPGSLKSLGAWGGDFVLVTGENANSYFSSKGFNTIIPFSEMIK